MPKTGKFAFQQDYQGKLDEHLPAARQISYRGEPHLLSIMPLAKLEEEARWRCIARVRQQVGVGTLEAPMLEFLGAVHGGIQGRIGGAVPALAGHVLQASEDALRRCIHVPKRSSRLPRRGPSCPRAA